ncbi:hypothetical protein KEM55_005220 [Ascosphaera atra]|nr:hypothetical protein KEM55_005220 [Ascosphaera atra]
MESNSQSPPPAAATDPLLASSTTISSDFARVSGSPMSSLLDDDSQDHDHLRLDDDDDYSISVSDDDDDDFSDYDSDAEREWLENVQQLQQLFSLVLVPFFGKFVGRKCAYWGWARFMKWKYPFVDIQFNPRVSRAAGAIEAASPL